MFYKFNNNVKDNLFVLFCFIIINFTFYKIGPVKVSEILLVILLPSLILFKTSKYFFYIFVVFTLLFLKTIFLNLFSDFEYYKSINNIPFIKLPYLVSISRYIQLLCGILFAHLVYIKLKNISNYRRKKIFKKLIFLHVYLSILLIVSHSLTYFKVIPLNSIGILYTEAHDKFGDTLRSRGFFIEGGPFGLMLSMVFSLTYYCEMKAKNLIRVIFIITIIFFARSKAGIMCIVFWFIYTNWYVIKAKIKSLSYFLIIPLLVIFISVFYLVSKVYIDRVIELENLVKEKPRNGILLTGRTSGSFIGANIILDKPFLGIGIGNYPYNRNKEEYRKFVPEFPKDYVSPRIGMGGVFMFIIENGIIGLFFYFSILFIIYKKYQKTKEQRLLILFIVLFVFGVEMTFMYPYFLLGVLLSKNPHYSDKL